MNKLENKIRIVSSDRYPTDKNQSKSILDKTKSLLGGNKKKPDIDKSTLLKKPRLQNSKTKETEVVVSKPKKSVVNIPTTKVPEFKEKNVPDATKQEIKFTKALYKDKGDEKYGEYEEYVYEEDEENKEEDETEEYEEEDYEYAYEDEETIECDLYEEEDVETHDVCGYGIYKDIDNIESVADMSDSDLKNKINEKSGKTVSNRLKGLLNNDRQEVKADREKVARENTNQVIVGNNRKMSNQTGGQGQNIEPGSLGDMESTELNDLSAKKDKKTTTPLLIGIIVGVTVIGIVLFIYFFSSSAMASIQVEPQPIQDIVHQEMLDGEFIPIAESEEVVEEKIEEEVENDIIVDTPQDKEMLEKRLAELEKELIDVRERNSNLGNKNQELITELTKIQKELDAAKIGENKGDKK